MRKFAISLFFVFFLCFSSFNCLSASAYTIPVGTELHAKAVYMVNVETGTVVYEKNAQESAYPASVTKLMTALVTLDQISDLSRVVTVYPQVISDLSGTGASIAGLLPGEQVTVEQLLACLLIPSACDASNILAMEICGSTEGFVALMNEKAAALGMKNTHYTNAHGLHDPAQTTTAYDLYLLANEVIQHEALTTICATASYTMPATNLSEARTFETTNFMINPTSSWYYKRVKGLKTGYTDDAGRNLVSLAEKDGQRYITVVLGCPAETLNGYQVHHEFDDTDALLRWAYTDLDYMCVVNSATVVGEVKVTLCAQTDYVTAVPAQDFYAIVPTKSADSVLIEPHLDKQQLEAPIQKGDILGTATVKCAGEEIGTIQLVAQQTCERNTFLLIKDRIIKVLTSKIFLILFGLILLAIIAFVIWNIQVNRRRRRLWNSKVRNRNR